ncbi:unnamed protein product [Ambrosiozyma monospora]|uniref:Unnamed protein product n=1 Tax=Ambrosiozyma monospora TaxID=43982 RepID=A0ACB5SUD6_AMBMO|nr:unnamed protein product [Ambrosiozyma monospora]
MNSVYLERKSTLQEKVDLLLKEVHNKQLDKLSKKALSEFTEHITKAKKARTKLSFPELLQESSKIAENNFIKSATVFHIAEAFNYNPALSKLQFAIVETSEQLKSKEKANLVARITKRFQNTFKEQIFDSLSSPMPDTWDIILNDFEVKKVAMFAPFKRDDGTYNFKLGLSEKENQDTAFQLEKTFWLKFRDIIHDFISEDTVSRILRNKFEDLFKYDEEGTPKIWKSAADVDVQYNKAKVETFALLPLFATAALKSTGEEIVPTVDISHEDELDGYDEFEDDEYADPHIFAHLLTNKEQNNIFKKLKRETDAIYVDAKRSIVTSTTQIPLYIYVIIAVLGWNEFMAILRNPLLFVLSIITVTGVYFAYNAEMLGPMLSIAFAMLEQTKKVAKEKLKDMLLDDDVRVPPSRASTQATLVNESIELDELRQLSNSSTIAVEE